MFGDREGERDGISSSKELPALEELSWQALLPKPLRLASCALQQLLLRLGQRTASKGLIAASAQKQRLGWIEGNLEQGKLRRGRAECSMLVCCFIHRLAVCINWQNLQSSTNFPIWDCFAHGKPPRRAGHRAFSRGSFSPAAPRKKEKDLRCTAGTARHPWDPARGEWQNGNKGTKCQGQGPAAPHCPALLRAGAGFQAQPRQGFTGCDIRKTPRALVVCAEGQILASESAPDPLWYRTCEGQAHGHCNPSEMLPIFTHCAPRVLQGGNPSSPESYSSSFFCS